MNKKGFEFTFAWIFAIIVGAFILFMAIYAVTKVIDTGRTTSDIKVGQGINVLLNPLETGFESDKVTTFSLPVDSRIYNDCELDGVFGSQVISISQKTFREWSKPVESGVFYNKYIFSEKGIEGRNFYLFSKPFEPLFKVNDYIYMIPIKEQYCFDDAPEEIKNKINLINRSFMITDNCPDSSIKVCFKSTGCDIDVNLGRKSISKDSGTVYFMGDEEDDGMLFAGIFSYTELYECQIARMIKRFGVLIEIYENKKILVAKEGCVSNVNLNPLISIIKNYENSKDIGRLERVIEETKRSYGLNPTCRLW